MAYKGSYPIVSGRCIEKKKDDSFSASLASDLSSD